MERSLPHLPQPRVPLDDSAPLTREYVARLGRLSAAVVLAGALLGPDEGRRDVGPAFDADFVGFGVSDNPDRIGG